MTADTPPVLDLGRLWISDGLPPSPRAYPLSIVTPADQWSWGMQIPTCVSRPASLRIGFRLADLRGKLRLGVVDGTNHQFIACAELDDTDAACAEIRLPADRTTGPLVAQNLSANGPTRFTLLSLDARIDPVYVREHDTHLTSYMRNGFNAIEGWCHYLHIAFLRGMDEAIFAHGVDGAVGEIGVHHGKHLIALHNLMQPGLRSVAVDVFGDSQFNLDRSGAGDHAVFLANMAAWAALPDNCLVLQRDSLVLREPDWAAIEAAAGPLKFFSIDGCHEVQHTLADIRTAMRLIAHGGVIMIDDYLSPEFPGVHQAVAMLFLHDRPPVAPFAIGQDKLYLTHVSHHAAYLKLAEMVMRDIPETTDIKPVQLYGYKAWSWRTADAGPDFPTGR